MTSTLPATATVANAEGRVVTVNGSAGYPVHGRDRGTVQRRSEPVQLAGAALLQLAWQHRRALLG